MLRFSLVIELVEWIVVVSPLVSILPVMKMSCEPQTAEISLTVGFDFVLIRLIVHRNKCKLLAEHRGLYARNVCALTNHDTSSQVPNIKKTVAAIRRNLTHSLSCLRICGIPPSELSIMSRDEIYQEHQI